MVCLKKAGQRESLDWQWWCALGAPWGWQFWCGDLKRDVNVLHWPGVVSVQEPKPGFG